MAFYPKIDADVVRVVTAETRGGVMSGYGWTTDNAGSPGFDADDRLTYWKRSDNNLTQNWTLSLVGDWNAFASQGTSQTRAHGPTHELTSVTIGNNTDTLQHDAKGNVTFIPAVLSATGSDLALSWDFDNRLVGANTDGQPGDEVTFQYDAQGRRVSKTVNGSTTVFVHAGQQIVADYPSGAAAPSPREKYVYASYIDEPILKDGTLPSGTGLAYYHHDRRYTITALTDSAGSAIERYAYSPYGSLTILDGSGSAIASSQTANRYTYTGREHDPETNLYHFRARYYSPTLGRFLNRDPLGYVDGMSLYRGYFVLGKTDPSGNSWTLCQHIVHHPTPIPSFQFACGHAVAETEFSFKFVGLGDELLFGYLVQNVKYTTYVWDCNDRQIFEEAGEYFEAWRVSESQIIQGELKPGVLIPHNVDKFVIATATGRKTKGMASLEGTVGFYPGVELGSDWRFPPNSHVYAPTLPTLTPGPPSWWQGGHLPTRRMSVVWDCCECAEDWYTDVQATGWHDT